MNEQNGQAIGGVLGGRQATNMHNECVAKQQACGMGAPERTVSATVEVRAVHGFGTALEAVIGGGVAITRAGWNAPGQWVKAKHPDRNSVMGQYLYLKNAQGDFVPWVPSQGDLFARDWAILPV